MGAIEVLVFPQLYEKNAQEAANDRVVLVKGRIEGDEEERKFLAQQIRWLPERPEGQTEVTRVLVNPTDAVYYELLKAATDHEKTQLKPEPGQSGKRRDRGNMSPRSFLC